MFAVVFAEATGSRHLSAKGKSTAACKKNRTERWRLPWFTLPGISLEIETVTCLSPAGLGDLHPPEAATAQPCGPREECHLHVHDHIEWIKIFTHAKFSFWLRVTQVSGKQAMFPRIPTQISCRNEQRRINLKPANDYILLLSHINSPWDVDNVI